MRGAGQAVRALLLTRGAAPSPTARAGWDQDITLDLEGHDTPARARALAAEAELIVSAGPYAPGALAGLIAGDRPWFADVPGDPLAELQALAICDPNAPDLALRARAAEQTVALVLGRADAFSVISEAQRHALIGQLGLLGRLTSPDATERAAVIPVAWRFPSPAQAPRARAAGDPLVVALVGGFNTWFDEATVIAGLDQALAAAPGLTVIALGGGISGHYTAGYARFSAWARAHPRRVALHPWAAEAELNRLLSTAHVGLSMDRPGYEAELGSRTRLLFFSHQGLLSVGTARAELALELREHRGLREVPVGRPEALAGTLVTLIQEPAPLLDISRAAAHLERRYGPDRVIQPLLDWTHAPRRTPAATRAESALLQQIAALQAELNAVQQSPTWRALSRGHGLVRRLRRRPT